MTEIHVDPRGDDRAAGNEAAPLRSIQAAADRARPGDVVTVHAGVYRERVAPMYGGSCAAERIVYRAAPGEHVVISGAELVTGWEELGDGLWTATLPDALFSDGHPFRDRLFGDWFIDEGRVHHRGDVYLDGASLFEVSDRAAVAAAAPWPRALDPEAARRCWCVEDGEAGVVLIANFGARDPRDGSVEVSVRPTCFTPRNTGIDFITVRGFEIRHAAAPWAPPTAEQIGAIGPHWSRGWIIEDNHIHDVRCSGISLGKERSTGENRWSNERFKHGTQRERETVFAALQRGWSRDTVGSHLVRRNHIHDCEQTGIVGHLGCIFSEIRDNHIHRIHAKAQFSGHEMSGIKLHAPIDVRIEGNHIHHARRGLWMDWQAQGTRITRNLCHDNEWDDVYVEVSHGPYVVDHNVLLSRVSVRNNAQGGAFLHNLLAGQVACGRIPNRFTPYHAPHATAVTGLMTILGGDDRWLHNLFLPTAHSEAKTSAADENADLAKRPKNRYAPRERIMGLQVYDGFPLPQEEWYAGNSVNDYAEHRLPVRIARNGYTGDARPFERETEPVTDAAAGGVIAWTLVDGGVDLEVDVGDALAATRVAPIDAARLGMAIQAEAMFEEANAEPLRCGRDLVGDQRGESSALGPWTTLASGRQTIAIRF